MPLGCDNVNQSEFVLNVDFFLGFPNKRLYLSPGSHFSYPPLGILIEFMLSRILDVKPVLIAYWLSLLVSGLNTALSYITAKALFNRTAAIFTAAINLFLYPNMILITWTGFPSLLGIFLYNLSLFLTITYCKNRSPISLFYLASTISTLLLTHIYSAIIVGVVFLFVVITSKNRFQFFKLFMVILIIVSPWYAYYFPQLIGNFNTFPTSFQRIVYPPADMYDVMGFSYFLSFFVVPAVFAIRLIYRNNRQSLNCLLIWYLIPWTLGILGSKIGWLGLMTAYPRPLYYVSFSLSVLMGGIFSLAPNLLKNVCRNFRIATLLSKTLTLCFIFFTLLFPLIDLPRIFQVYKYYSFMSSEELEALNFMSANTTGLVVSDWYFGQWIAGYAGIPTICALPANVYYTNPVEFSQGQIADVILSKKGEWLSLARNNGINYIVINTRLSYIDAYIPTSPTYFYYDITKYFKQSKNFADEFLAWNWSLTTQNSFLTPENGSIVFGSSYSLRKWYALRIFPVKDEKYEYLVVNISLSDPFASLIDPKVILYYDNNEFNEYPICDKSKFFITLDGKNLSEIRIAAYSTLEGSSWSFRINDIKFAKSLADYLDPEELSLVYQTRNIFILKIVASSQFKPSFYNFVVYPLYIYIPSQAFAFYIGFIVFKNASPLFVSRSIIKKLFLTFIKVTKPFKSWGLASSHQFTVPTNVNLLRKGES